MPAPIVPLVASVLVKLAPLTPYVVIGAVAAVAAARRARKRRVMAAESGEGGFAFREVAPEYTGRWLVAPFGVEANRTATHCTDGRYREVPFATFEVAYPVPAGDTVLVDVAVLFVGAARLPDLQIVPTGWTARLTGARGRGPQVLLAENALGGGHAVHCADADFARRLLSEEALDRLAPLAALSGGLMLAIVGGDVILSRVSEKYAADLFGPGDPTQALEDSDAPFDIVLSMLLHLGDRFWLDHGGRPATLSRGMR